MASLSIAAHYARMVHPFVSHDETRYYLGGFYVEPHPDGGAIIVGTNGHVMGIFHDRLGTCSEPGIVKLDRFTLRACGRSGGHPLGKIIYDRPIILNVEGDRATVSWEWKVGAGDEAESESRMFAIQHGALIDGTYPDWRKVVPKLGEVFTPSTYSPSVLKPFTEVAGFGKGSGEGRGQVTVYATDLSGPALVMTSRKDFFGIAMPMRSDIELPTWWAIERAKPDAPAKKSSRKQPAAASTGS